MSGKYFLFLYKDKYFLYLFKSNFYSVLFKPSVVGSKPPSYFPLSFTDKYFEQFLNLSEKTFPYCPPCCYNLMPNKYWSLSAFTLLSIGMPSLAQHSKHPGKICWGVEQRNKGEKETQMESWLARKRMSPPHLNAANCKRIPYTTFKLGSL